MAAQHTAPAHSEQSELASPGQFDIIDESLDGKAEIAGEGEFDNFVNQDHAISGIKSSASSSTTVFDPTNSADRDRYGELDEDLAKDFSASTPFLSPNDEETPPVKPAAPGPVTWLSLPRKGQLFILFLCRFVDFLQVASLQAYVFYQLKFIAEQRMLATDGTGTSRGKLP